VSEPRHTRVSRLDPINWPSGTGIVLFAFWVAYAVACTVWVHLLLWTVLPSGLALYLFAERYPWPVIVVFVLPLTLLTAFAQVVATWADTPLWISFAIYLIACAYFSVVVSDPNRDSWAARLPRRLLGERFSSRLAWARFEKSLVVANALVRQTNAGNDQVGRHAALDRLAKRARQESHRGGIWWEAWAAHAGWLEGLDTLADAEPSADQVRHVNDLLTAMNRSHMRAIEQTAVLDPAAR
jgi:hypothetical protein